MFPAPRNSSAAFRNLNSKLQTRNNLRRSCNREFYQKVRDCSLVHAGGLASSTHMFHVHHWTDKSYTWLHTPFLYMTTLFHHTAWTVLTWNLTHSYVRHDSIIYETWSMLCAWSKMRLMTLSHVTPLYSFVRHLSDISLRHVTHIWLINMWDMTHA